VLSITGFLFEKYPELTEDVFLLLFSDTSMLEQSNNRNEYKLIE
jgi:hypothetical protein